MAVSNENETLTGQSGARLGARGPEEQLRQQLTSQCEGRRVEISVARRQGWIRVVARLVVIVLDVQVLHLAVVDAQRAARVVYVLPVEVLKFEILLIKYSSLKIYITKPFNCISTGL